MKSQIRLARVFGVELGLHYSWIVIALLIAFSLAGHFHAVNPDWSSGVIWGVAIVTAILFFACLFAHELSHALVAKAHGLPIHKITLFIFGGAAQIEKEAGDAATEFWMGIVGPITSAVLGFILLAIASAGGWTRHAPPATPGLALLVWLGYINIALAVFNMIPGFPLDGGRVLRAIIWWITASQQRATRIAVRVGQIVALLLIAYGILQFFAGAVVNGLWLAFIGWFLMQAAGASYFQMQADTVLRGVRVRDIMSKDCISVDAEVNLQQFVEDQLLRTGRRCFVVLKNGSMAGLLTPSDVREIDRTHWNQMTVGAAMKPVSQLRFVRPDAPAREALETMARQDVNQLPVVADGRLEGVVSRGNILRLLQARHELAA